MAAVFRVYESFCKVTHVFSFSFFLSRFRLVVRAHGEEGFSFFFCVCVSRCDRNIVMFVTVRAFWAYMGLYGHRLDVERAVLGLEEHEVREVHLHVCVEAHFVRDGCCKVAPDDAVVHAVRRLS